MPGRKLGKLSPDALAQLGELNRLLEKPAGSEPWQVVGLKLDEAAYHCGQMKAHLRHTRPFLFSLSSFLVASKGVDYYVRKHVVGRDASRKRAKEELWSKYCSDELGAFMQRTRDEAVHERFPALRLEILVRRHASTRGPSWTLLGKTDLPSPWSRQSVEIAERWFAHDWGPGLLVNPVWLFSDYAGKERGDVLAMCDEWLVRITDFCDELRWSAASPPS